MTQLSPITATDLHGFTPTQAAMLSLLGSALCETPSIPMPEEVDWQAVLDEMVEQTVFAIPRGVLPDSVPTAIKASWDKRCLQNIAKTVRLLVDQENAIRILSAIDPSIVVLKGAAAALYYPNPLLRCMGDVDLISIDGRFEDMCDTFEANGFDSLGKAAQSHDQYTKNGILFEPHRFFAAPPESRSPIRYVDGAINAAGDRVRTESVCGFETPMLPDAENGLVLLAHLVLHMQRGIGMRHICDWMMFASRICDDAFWRDELEPMARRAGLDMLAKVATKACQLYLGLPEEGRSWCAGADKSLCRSLLDDALANGNFGRKRSAVLDYNDGIRRYSMKHPLDLARKVQRTGREKLEEKGFGRSAAAFGWLYQSLRLASRYCEIKSTVKTHDARNVARSRSEMIEALGLSEIMDM